MSRDSDASLEKARLHRLLEAKRAGDMEYLLNALTNVEERPLAAHFLADLGHRDAVPRIVRLLDARDSWARIAGVKALGKLRAKELIPRLTELAQTDPERQVRLWAIASLGEIGDPGVLPILVTFLHNDEWVVRRAAAFALGLLGDRRAVRPLQVAMKRERFLRRYPYRNALEKLTYATTNTG